MPSKILSSFDVSRNSIVNIEQVYEAVSGLEHLQTLDFGGNSMTDREVTSSSIIVDILCWKV